MCHAPRIAALVLTNAQKKGSAEQLPNLKALAKRGTELEGLPSWIDPRARFDNELDLPPGLQEILGELAHWSGAAIKLVFDDRAKQRAHCVKCAAEISRSARFGTKCGAEQHTSPLSGPEILIERMPSNAARASTTSGSGWQCAKCRQANPKRAKFCMNCAAPAPRS